MKTLLLVRHAKSSWKEPRLTDHQRPLNKRGKQAAPEMGRRLKKRGVKPDAIVSSDARRALDTAILIADALNLSQDFIHEAPDLYHAGPDRILKLIHQFTDTWHMAMVVGHNPGFTELADRFYPSPIVNVPTAGIVEFCFKTPSWTRIGRDNLETSAFDFPKNKPR